MDGAQIRIVEEIDQEGLGGLLQRSNGLTLPPERFFGRVRDGDCDFANLNDTSQSPVPMKGSGSNLTTRWNGSFRRRSSVDFWYLRISRSAIVPGL
jgi:hypothetical protein